MDEKRILRKASTMFLGAALALLLSGPAASDDITVSGNPGALMIGAAIPGSGPDAVIDESTTYGVDITTDNNKITGSLSSALPAHTTLEITLAAPDGATSAGRVVLSTTARDLVTGLLNGTSQSGLTIKYEYSATVDAGVVPSSSTTVTMTIVNN